MDCKVELDHHELFIDGKRVAPSSGEYSIDLNPATEDPIAEVAEGGKADVDLAVRAARNCSRTLGDAATALHTGASDREFCRTGLLELAEVRQREHSPLAAERGNEAGGIAPAGDRARVRRPRRTRPGG